MFGEHEPVELVEIGESVAKDDGCSKAYEKFKANVDKMTALKDAAVKKGEEADKKSRESVAGLKRCKDDQKEVLAKAEYKKDVMDKKIEEAAKKKFEEMKKPLEEKVSADKKKHDAALAEAKKKEAEATKKAEEAKKKLEDTTRDLKAKYEKDLAKHKAQSKAEFEKKLNDEVTMQVGKKSQEIQKAEQEKSDKKLKDQTETCDANAEKTRKKNTMDKETVAEEHKAAIAAARKEVPPEVEKELTETKDKLTAATKDLQKLKSDHGKLTADCKDTKAELTAKNTKNEMRASDCLARETGLNKELAASNMQVKTQDIKIKEKESDHQRVSTQLQETTSKLEVNQESLKAKEEELKVTTSKLHEATASIQEKDGKIKMIMSKMSAGEGALMAEIENLKKGLSNEQDQLAQVSNHLSKCRQETKKVEGELSTKVVKLRETGQELYTTKRDLEKEKTKFETLQMAHTTTTERYRDVSSKKELCEDRMKDSKIKEQGCEEAMRRMKTYNADADTEQKMEIARLRQELDQCKEDANRMVVSQEEKQKADDLAKQATEKAVSQAVETAQANALAVKTNAQEAVDQAAKEAVRLANEQAATAANAGGSL